MEKNPKSTAFAFSWADEVEREEQEQQQQEQKANPFGAARPREVVLEEKGVDWRARDRELDISHSSLRKCKQIRRNARTACPPKNAAVLLDSMQKDRNCGLESCTGMSSKRKCAGERSAEAAKSTGRRRVLGDLNIQRSGRKSHKNCNKVAASNNAGGEDVNSRKPVTNSGESGVGHKRRRRGRRKKSKKTNILVD